MKVEVNCQQNLIDNDAIHRASVGVVSYWAACDMKRTEMSLYRMKKSRHHRRETSSTKQKNNVTMVTSQ